MVVPYSEYCKHCLPLKAPQLTAYRVTTGGAKTGLMSAIWSPNVMTNESLTLQPLSMHILCSGASEHNSWGCCILYSGSVYTPGLNLCHLSTSALCVCTLCLILAWAYLFVSHAVYHGIIVWKMDSWGECPPNSLWNAQKITFSIGNNHWCDSSKLSQALL